MRRSLAPILVLVLATLGGCMASTGTETPLSPPPTASAPNVMGGSYVCPPQGVEPAGGGVCARSFNGPFDYMVEPTLAINPTDTAEMAFVANAGQSANGLEPAPANSELHSQRFALFITKDGGASWSRLELPEAPPPPQSLPESAYTEKAYWDPMVGFDGDGTLHVGGVLMWSGPNGESRHARIFHIKTADLGTTWSSYTLIGDSVDRPWMVIGDDDAISIVWFRPRDHTLGFARSVDRGDEWFGLPEDVKPIPCYMASPTQHRGTLYVACPREERRPQEPDTPPTGIYRYDAVRNGFDLVSSLPSTFNAILASPRDGSLMFIGMAYGTYNILVERSVDDGATWQSLPELGKRIQAARPWSFLQFMGGRADPWGTIEVYVRGLAVPPRPDVPNGAYLDLPTWLSAAYADEFAVAHVVIDPMTGTIVTESLVTPTVSHMPTGSPSLGVSRAGDYYGIDFTDDKAVLVWEYQRSLFLTYWEPDLQ